MQNIHGHIILDLIGAAAEPLTFSQIESRVLEQFGTDARFKTCNSEGHTLLELIAVLEERGKLSSENGVYGVHAHKVCQEESVVSP